MKVVLLGESGGGKTTLARRWAGLRPVKGATVGVGYFLVRLGPVRLQVWDTAGQERYDSLVPLYCRNADVGVVLSDDTARYTKHLRPGARVVAVTSKADLLQPSEMREEGRWYVSAKTGHGCGALLREVARLASEAAVPTPPPPASPARAPARGCC